MERASQSKWSLKIEEKNGWTHLRGGYTMLQSQFGVTPFTKALGASGVADQLSMWGDVWIANSAKSPHCHPHNIDGPRRMFSCPAVQKRVIRGHYDLTTPFYRLFWGPHIHHGLWDADESPREAQLQLTEQLASLARITAGQQLVDVGCGMGASSIHLAKTRDCRCLGITISPLQRKWAALSARWHRVSGRVEFRCADAEQVDLPQNSCDVVWSVECTEHLFDKPRFFERAAAWLKPGGTMALCAWLAGDTSDAGHARQVHDVCEGFFCPSLGTSDDYTQWMSQAGLRVDRCLDWTSRVSRTWEICRERVRRSRIRWLAPLAGHDSALFLDRFDAILDAYRSGAMRYGCFVARKLPNV